MSVMQILIDTREQELVLRLRRHMAMRILVGQGTSQREIALALGVSQSSVSMQMRPGAELEPLEGVELAVLAAAAGPLLADKAQSFGLRDLALVLPAADEQLSPAGTLGLIATGEAQLSVSGLDKFQRFAQWLLGLPVEVTLDRPGAEGLRQNTLLLV